MMSDYVFPQLTHSFKRGYTDTDSFDYPEPVEVIRKQVRFKSDDHPSISNAKPEPRTPKTGTVNPLANLPPWFGMTGFGTSPVSLAPSISPGYLMSINSPVAPRKITDEQLINMRGPSRLVGFLFTTAMNEDANDVLRWTGVGLEFVLVNRDTVAKMWGNRKHNTKDMDYHKLSRAIREKYEKKDANGVIKHGKLKKGSRIYSYVFTDHAFPDLMKHTSKSIEEIKNYAIQIGEKYKDCTDALPSSPSSGPEY